MIPMNKTEHPWRPVVHTDTENVDYSISTLIGWYQDGTLQHTILWKGNFWERLKFLFSGTIALHIIDTKTIPKHKLEVGLEETSNMEKTWNGDKRVIDTIYAMDIAAQAEYIRKEFEQ